MFQNAIRTLSECNLAYIVPGSEIIYNFNYNVIVTSPEPNLLAPNLRTISARCSGRRVQNFTLLRLRVADTLRER